MAILSYTRTITFEVHDEDIPVLSSKSLDSGHGILFWVTVISKRRAFMRWGKTSARQKNLERWLRNAIAAGTLPFSGILIYNHTNYG